jgi:hypothetical protein
VSVVTIDKLDLLRDRLLGLDELEPGADRATREAGLDWPSFALSMIGVKRMDNIRSLVETIIRDGIEGDLIECGVWRGGACIFMKAILETHGDTRNVYVADSFKGFPTPKFDMDKGANFLEEPILKVSKEVVESNFEAYGLLDDRVQFIEGYFGDTLPKFEGQLALLRVDGDLFESTTDVLNNLYDKVSRGGFIIIDDFGQLEVCKMATLVFRANHNVRETMISIDQAGIYWRKER